MSVPASKQGLAQMQYHKNAKIFIDIFTDMNLKKFGIYKKLKDRNVPNPTKENSDNITVVEDFINRDDTDMYKKAEEYPEWLWERLRKLTIDSAWEGYNFIVSANAHYPNTPEEAALRRQDINNAIAKYTDIVNGLQWTCLILPINKDKIQPYIDLLGKQIYLLKLWRKGIEKILKAAVTNSKK